MKYGVSETRPKLKVGAREAAAHLPTDLRAFFLVLSGATPACFLLAMASFGFSLSKEAHLLVACTSFLWIVVTAISVRGDFRHHIRTLSNLVEATRDQDYSMKSSRARGSGELAELYQQINTLTDSLRTGRQSEQELLSILETVVGQINVAIVVCDSRDNIRLVNLRAHRLLHSTDGPIIGTAFADTALAALSLSTRATLVNHRFPGGTGRWQVSQQHYRHQGQPSRIIFITDLNQVLSDEEIAAWQRLIRVISHEVNNSLTPITSLCQTLVSILAKSNSTDYTDDVRGGLNVIGERARGLKTFISAYARVARLPEPHKVFFPVAQLVDRVSGIFRDEPVIWVGTVPEARLFGDPVQLEQVLINLMKNALEANAGSTDTVRFGCRIRGNDCEFEIIDNGAGIKNPGNLFVPFYTTKSEGAGVGLVLSRQIANKHFGHVTLDNRADGHGAQVKLILPLYVAHTS